MVLSNGKAGLLLLLPLLKYIETGVQKRNVFEHLFPLLQDKHFVADFGCAVFRRRLGLILGQKILTAHGELSHPQSYNINNIDRYARKQLCRLRENLLPLGKGRTRLHALTSRQIPAEWRSRRR